VSTLLVLNANANAGGYLAALVPLLAIAVGGIVISIFLPGRQKLAAPPAGAVNTP